MNLIKLTQQEFNTFVDNQNNSSFYQSEEYARFMSEEDYEYDLMGIKDSYGNVRAASLIIYKKFDSKNYFGYAPRGFLIDYRDKDLVNDFAKALLKYYKRKNIIFIKINPNIIISNYNNVTKTFNYNSNVKFIEYLKKNKFQELKKSKNFEALIPTFTPIVDLKTFSYRGLDKNVRNKISKSYRKGLSIDKSDINGIKELFPFIKNKTKKNESYYENLYHSFDKNKSIDVFLIKVNFEEFLVNTKSKYEDMLEKSKLLNKQLTLNPDNEKLICRKLQLDKELLNLKNDIITATNGLSNNKIEVVGGAIVIKYKNKVTIFTSGYNKKYKELNINDFLYYKLMEYYKYNFDLLDLNGISGDLSKESPYRGLNKFKMGFNPMIYEDIGEFDIIFNKRVYNKVSADGTLAKLFNKIK